MASIIALVFAASLNPGGIIAWIVLGLIAGVIASLLMRGGGYGIIGDIIVGIVGAFIGGLIIALIFPNESFGFWGSLIVAIIGACILIAILRAVARGRTA
ncbi:GlsB/YeaQ/YmgE family stress response membrane protein [Ktedonosporobacter rubrisoli]|uniref:GlsB/YeaQ/YmgE family stress response membrane protein n=1 Tax=Ktedonosporobacter rubrisoli TaxID=2509675 RepID=A0A4P6K1T6_KTERU|nr:GlsB/YeaQ/YmgE family stress response membrane protein [Ktedonosporobacter rubrisoli]QBD81436.1 GlsB/YeaQ/YmgE family stress response membrane protein [Ktedonosporobacter rubrisoli]